MNCINKILALQSSRNIFSMHISARLSSTLHNQKCGIQPMKHYKHQKHFKFNIKNLKNGNVCRTSTRLFSTAGVNLGSANNSASFRSFGTNAAASPALKLNEEVRAALAEGRPVVALESTIITHGMPHPDNLNTALELEAILRSKDCTPATVGVVKGEFIVGLSPDELQELADTNRETHKISTRDLSHAIAMKLSGGTTVAGTLTACRLAGIPVFVTGGIGGVHRSGNTGGQPSPASLDISADLVELGRCRGVGVVCAGVKSILDVAGTLEYLETQGVGVAVLDPCLPPGTVSSAVRFPDFFTRDSGLPAPSVIRDAAVAASMINSNIELGLNPGLLFAVPIPRDAEPAGKEIKMAIEASLQEAHLKGVFGRDVTPFVLSRVMQLTEGKSLLANAALIRNNARVGADIAVALAKLRAKEYSHSFLPSSSVRDDGERTPSEQPLAATTHQPVCS